MTPVHVKTTLDGRKVEVIGRYICLDGEPETNTLVVIEEHPNRQAILRAVPKTTHVAGRIPLTMAEASVAQAALRRATDTFDGTLQTINERLRKVAWQKVFAEGAE
jgi:hypothetical protein